MDAKEIAEYFIENPIRNKYFLNNPRLSKGDHFCSPEWLNYVEQLAKGHLDLIHKLENPSEEMITATGARVGSAFYEQQEIYFKEMTAVMLGEK